MCKTNDKGYTQRQWDRTVGWGEVPDKYRRVSPSHTDGQDTERSNPNREKNKGTVEET